MCAEGSRPQMANSFAAAGNFENLKAATPHALSRREGARRSCLPTCLHLSSGQQSDKVSEAYVLIGGANFILAVRAVTTEFKQPVAFLTNVATGFHVEGRVQ